jgi:hypothetical protein
MGLVVVDDRQGRDPQNSKEVRAVNTGAILIARRWELPNRQRPSVVRSPGFPVAVSLSGLF